MASFADIYDLLKQEQEKTYWESNEPFVKEGVSILGLNSKDSLVEAGSGKGIAACLFALGTHVDSVVGIEIVKDRHDAAQASKAAAIQLAGQKQKLVSTIEFINDDFMSDLVSGSIDKSTVIYCAVNDDREIKNFLKTVLVKKPPGFRICTNLHLRNFELSVMDPRIQVVRIDAKTFQDTEFFESLDAFAILQESSQNANTTLKKTFVPFYVYTVRRGQTAFGTDSKKSVTKVGEKVGKKVFISLQIGELWTTFEGVIIETKSTHCLVETSMSDTSDCILSTWLPVEELFDSRSTCEAVTLSRNTIQPVHVADIPPTNPITGMEYIIGQYFTPEVAKTLGIHPEDVLYIEGDYVCGTHRFDFVINQNVDEYFEKTNPKFNYPCKFSKEASLGLKFKTPSETLTCMSSLYGNKDKTKHDVFVTNKNLRVSTTKSTIHEMEKVFRTSYENRKSPQALLHLKVMEKDRYFVKPPRALRDYDRSNNRQYGFPDVRDYLTSPMLDLMASMIGKGSLLRFHCNEDGAIVWLTVVRGIKIVFFILDPSDDDKHFLGECNKPDAGKNLYSESMKGRVVCTVLREGETLIYPGNLPHAFYAAEDVLCFGGHYLVPPKLGFNLTFNKDEHGCSGFGYTHKQLVEMTYNGLGNIWFNLWKIKIMEPKKFKEYGPSVMRAIGNLFQHSKLMLKFSDEQYEWTTKFFTSLNVSRGSNLRQSVFGVFYSNDSAPQIEEAFGRILKGKAFCPALVNVTDGLPFRKMNLPNKEDIDYDDDKTSESRRVDLGQIFPLLLTHTSSAVVGICSYQFGMYAAIDLPKDAMIAQFTGHIRTDTDLQIKYGPGKPPGKIYWLNEFVYKKREPENVWVDANEYGSFSLFVKHSETPNCRLERIIVQNRATLIVYTDVELTANTELLIPTPQFFKPGKGELVSINDYLQAASPEQPAVQPTHLESHSPVKRSPWVLRGNRTKPRVLKAPTKSKPKALTQGEPEVTDTAIQREPEVAQREPEVVDDGQVAGPSRQPQRIMTRKTAARTASKSKLATRKGKEKPESSDDEYMEPQSSESSDSDDDNQPPRGKGRKMRRKGQPRVPKVNLKSYKIHPPSPEDSDEWEGGTPAGRFVLNNTIHEAHHVPRYPNTLLLPIYRDLSPERQEALRNMLVALFYPRFLNYVTMNRRLLRLYNQNIEEMRFSCAICAHFGYPINGFPDEVFHKFGKAQKFKNHHKRYHKERLQCETCKEYFISKHKRDGHYRSMVKKQHPPHVADAAKRVEKRNEEKDWMKQRRQERGKTAKSCAQEALNPDVEEEEECQEDDFDFDLYDVDTEESSQDEPTKEGSDQESQ